MTFPATGYLLARSALPPAFHRDLVGALDVITGGQDAGHEAFAALPVSAIVVDPVVREALTSALGQGYLIDPCRHVHANSHPFAGPWHRDDYCGRPWPPGQWALLAYFPQDTPAEMGPTAVMAGSQRSDVLVGTEVVGAGPAGTFLLMDVGMWHRATANVVGARRYMLKFLFRTTTSEEEA